MSQWPVYQTVSCDIHVSTRARKEEEREEKGRRGRKEEKRGKKGGREEGRKGGREEGRKGGREGEGEGGREGGRRKGREGKEREGRRKGERREKGSGKDKKERLASRWNVRVLSDLLSQQKTTNCHYCNGEVYTTYLLRFMPCVCMEGGLVAARGGKAWWIARGATTLAGFSTGDPRVRLGRGGGALVGVEEGEKGKLAASS